MSKNGPDGTTFLTENSVLDQEVTLIFSLALLPSCKIVYSDSQIVTQSLEGGDARRMQSAYVGVNGGLAEAKKIVCETIDGIWKQLC